MMKILLLKNVSALSLNLIPLVHQTTVKMVCLALTAACGLWASLVENISNLSSR